MEIVNLSEQNKRPTLEILVKANVGTNLAIIRFFNKVIRNNTKSVFVVIDNKKIMGAIGWYQDKGNLARKALGNLFPKGNAMYWISYFAVDESVRNKGIGTLLVKKLLTELRKKNAKELWVFTRRAKGFYEKLDFVFVKRANIESELQDFMKYIFK